MRRYSQDERRAIVRAFKASGMTQREFARTNGVNFHTLQHWLHYKPKRSSAEQPATRFVEVKPIPSQVGTAAIRMHVSADLELSLAELPPPAYLAELARTLGETC